VIGLNENATRVRYRTQTERGSGGAPCFDRGWNLVAMHHMRDPAMVSAAQWRQGIPIAAIRERLQRVGKLRLLGGTRPLTPKSTVELPPPQPGPILNPQDPQQGAGAVLPTMTDGG
jgi:hypothetical protein